MKQAKHRRGILALMLSLVFTLSLLTACGGGGDSSDKGSSSESGEDNGVVGLWESEDWGGICLELLDDGTGTIYTYSDMGDLTYEWDGETLTILREDEDGELKEVTGELQKDGSIGIMGLGYFFPVEERSYGPDMAGSSFMEVGGMEGELEGDWIHSSGNRMLTFDGSGSVTFHETFEGGSSSSSSGWYSYDGETVTVDTSAGIAEGYIDSMGDLIIEIDGEGGWYSPGDSSQLTYPDITGPEAELVGEWANSSTGDSVEFTSDGSVVYAIGGSFGVASPFTFDGETVTFSDYTGYIDSEGDLIVEGLDGWFSRTAWTAGSAAPNPPAAGARATPAIPVTPWAAPMTTTMRRSASYSTATAPSPSLTTIPPRTASIQWTAATSGWKWRARSNMRAITTPAETSSHWTACSASSTRYTMPGIHPKS